jgi:hypothetical protein
MAKKKSNLAKGKDSYDSEVGGSLVAFFNRNVTPYPTEVGGPAFDLIPVTQRKDIMVNAARMHAEQEYNRITELMAVLAKQAAELKRRLDITDMVHAAEYQFQPAHGRTYWLCYDSKIENTRLCMQGPTDWTTGVPEHYEYITQVKWLGDYTWTEVTTQTSADSNPQS